MPALSMMHQPLTVGSIIQHASRYHGDTEIASVETQGGVLKSNWGTVEANAKKLASALETLGVEKGDRVATLAWNNVRHLEIYYGTSGAGMVCHTLNPRLVADHIIFMIEEAQDQILFVDHTFLPIVAKIRTALTSVKAVVLMGPSDPDAAALIEGLLFYDELLESANPNYTWPDVDENSSASLCYTSGTTGNPKGVLYTNRSIVLHALAAIAPDAMNISGRDTFMPVAPMFHVTAWGAPYSAGIAGAKLVLPGPGLDGASLVDLIDAEKVTIALGVPTIWLNLLAELKKRGTHAPSMTHAIVGGAAMPPSMFTEFRDLHGIELIHGWGMTETSPLGSVNQAKSKHASLTDEEMSELRLGQGRPLFGVELRIVDNDGNVLSNDGTTQGELQVRGHWVVHTYFGQSAPALTADGWFETGDIATIDQDGYVIIRDRSKDIIKSGGEWISTVELENIAVGHPAIANAAAIGVKHPKWDERPVIVAIKSAPVTEQELLAWYEGKVAHWQEPDGVIFVDELPIGATGKILKNKLRDQYADMLNN